MEEHSPLRIILPTGPSLSPSIATPLMPGMLELLESKRRVANNRDVGPRVVMDEAINDIRGKLTGLLRL
jgi:hypothetical protein